MARRRQEVQVGEDHDTIIRWYRDRLAEPAPPPSEHRWPPVIIGPTWQRTPDGLWLLPERTLGWDVLGWCGTWLQHGKGRPWRFTMEQARWLLWWYSLDDVGGWEFEDGVLQRLKGWGKDPLGACLCANEMLGPARFGGWDGDEPIAIDVPNAWIQTAAVSLEQTKNTTRLFPSLFTPEAVRTFKIQIGKTLVHALNGRRLIEAVTSSPATLEGGRPTFVLKNETHHWLANNEGHAMADVIERNDVKSDGGTSRALSITNAFEPGEDSTAQREREAWESMKAGKAVDVGVLYDSLEAPPEAPLSAEAAPHVVKAICGDAVWLSVARIVKSILDIKNPASRSRRFWYNQITATEDAWTSTQDYDACFDIDVLVADGATITLGFDGSVSDDDSALIGCDVELDHLFEIKVWRPEKATGTIDRDDVDRTVRAMFERFDVVGFYSDLHPWESYVDRWATDFGDDLLVKASPRQPVAWDIRSRGQQFTKAVERLYEAIVQSARQKTEASDRGEQPGARLTHDGSRAMRQHFHNARRAPNPWGVSVRKEHRESARKIDSVPAAVLARLARLDYLALPAGKRKRAKKRTGGVW